MARDKDKGFRKSVGDSSDNQGDVESSRFPPGEGGHGYAPDSGRTSAELAHGGNRAFQPHSTQDASRSEGGAIYKPARGAKYVGRSVNAQGNELALSKREAGREYREREGADRPVGVSTARWSSGVRPLESITTEQHSPSSTGR